MTRPDRHQAVDVEGFARRIIDARAASRTLPAPLGHGLSPDDAYRVQALVLDPRMRAGGGRGGWKLGYTSAVMREQMGIAEPNFGPLARGMVLADGALVADGVTQPRVEPEIAAVLGADVPPGAILEEVSSCVASWHVALEVVDSVWEGYRFDWALNTADGSSAAYVVLGDEIPASYVRHIEVELVRNGEVVGEGRADAAMGDPAKALAWLVAALAQQGGALRSGDVVITGGLSRAVEFAKGDRVSVRARAAGGPVLATASVGRSAE